MRKQKWTEAEIDSLKKQCKAGVPLGEIRISGRSVYSIKYKMYDLGISSSRKITWSKNQLKQLRSAIRQNTSLRDISIPGKTFQAIKNKAVRSGLWQTKKRVCRFWTTREIAKLKKMRALGWTASKLVSNNHFPGRSVHSIAQQLSRLNI